MPISPPRDHEPTTEHTGRIYRDDNWEATLFLLPMLIEYSTTAMTLATTWDNVRTLRQPLGRAVLILARPAEYHPQNTASVPAKNTRFLRIPLSPFGYPSNRDLRDDLMRFAPHLHLL